MSARSDLRGHDIEFCTTKGEWVYSDTKESTKDTYEERACGFCGAYSTKEGHDSCLGTLPNIMNACCGHGRIEHSYVQFMDGSTVHGEEATPILKKLMEDSIHVEKG